MRHVLPIALLALVCACKPPATDEYVERVDLTDAGEPQRAPIASPDTEGAGWAPSGPQRIVYGKPGAAPLLALECADGQVALSRFAATDKGAKALMALIGNGHRSRMKVDAAWNGNAFLWRGSYAADDPLLEALTGPNSLEATVPGAGTVKLNASPEPRRLVEACRSALPQADEPEETEIEFDPEEPAQE